MDKPMTPEQQARTAWLKIREAMKEGAPCADEAEWIIAAAIREAVADERERCAKVAASWRYVPGTPATGACIAADIRAMPVSDTAGRAVLAAHRGEG